MVDFATYTRFFIAVPILIAAEVVVGPRLTAATIKPEVDENQRAMDNANAPAIRATAEQTADPRVDLAVQRTELALDRTRLAWVRTAFTFITPRYSSRC